MKKVTKSHIINYFLISFVQIKYGKYLFSPLRPFIPQNNGILPIKLAERLYLDGWPPAHRIDIQQEVQPHVGAFDIGVLVISLAARERNPVRTVIGQD